MFFFFDYQSQHFPRNPCGNQNGIVLRDKARKKKKRNPTMVKTPSTKETEIGKTALINSLVFSILVEDAESKQNPSINRN